MLPVRGVTYEMKRAPWISWVTASDEWMTGMDGLRFRRLVKLLDYMVKLLDLPVKGVSMQACRTLRPWP
ncbi:hypothetical protein GCM10010121_011170 [Streptomyces brasiliensis]|uniref:Uncharacterized protein n=1 Tax=Streptomyces brasiliensis TaxID=1954 RepID=A0A917K9B4_9ACTN|nr:hypothetical protein GCM10010121_011170 [Streptomyces brasiliensis]